MQLITYSFHLNRLVEPLFNIWSIREIKNERRYFQGSINYYIFQIFSLKEIWNGCNAKTSIWLWPLIAWITFLSAWFFAIAWLFTAFFAFAAWFFTAFFLTFTFASALFFFATFGAAIIRSHRFLICNGIHPKNFRTGRSWTLLSLSAFSSHSTQQTASNRLWCGKCLQ